MEGIVSLVLATTLQMSFPAMQLSSEPFQTVKQLPAARAIEQEQDSLSEIDLLEQRIRIVQRLQRFA